MANLPKTCLPDWSVAELPEPKNLGFRNLRRFIGPGIVMCGIQLAGGEWLLGAEITARYGGSLMWIAAVAIVGERGGIIPRKAMVGKLRPDRITLFIAGSPVNAIY